MRRRSVLAAIVALSGCTTSPGERTDTKTATQATAESSATPTSTREPTASPEQSGAGCLPALDDDLTVYCGNDETAPHTTASSETITNPHGEATFTLTNGGETPLLVDRKSFQLYRHDGDGWQVVLQKMGFSVGYAPLELLPDEQLSWTLRSDVSDLEPTAPPGTDEERTAIFRFLPGRYAFGLDASREGSDERLRYAAQFEVEGEQIPLLPSAAVEGHSREGNTLTVRTGTSVENDESREVSLVCDRVKSAENSARLDRFELYNPRFETVRSYDRTFVDVSHAVLLRDAFAFAESDDDRIRVETMDTTIPPLGLANDDSLAVRYEGTTWRLTAENGWA